MDTALEICEEKVAIHRNERSLEGVLVYAFNRGPTWSVLIAGPHPLLGGDMSNNVVTSLARNLAAAGAVALTFNYAGVGDSEGGPADWPAVMSEFWNKGCFQEEADWIEDTSAAIAALREWCDRPLVLLGYSFGCWTIAQHAAIPSRALILISPNPKKHAFAGLDGCNTPLLVLHSDNDFACGADEIASWFDGLGEPKTRRVLPAGEHFFRGEEEKVVRAVLDFLTAMKLEGVTSI